MGARRIRRLALAVFRRITVLIARQGITRLALVVTALSASAGCASAAQSGTTKRVAGATAPSSFPTSRRSSESPRLSGPTSVRSVSTRPRGPGLAGEGSTSPVASPTVSWPAVLTRLPSTTREAIVVSTADLTSTSGQVFAYARVGQAWSLIAPPVFGWVGSRGLAPSGRKVEGDFRTPEGIYPLVSAFGVGQNPGTGLPWQPVLGMWDVWDDDPGSMSYNTRVDLRRESAGVAPEPLDNPAAYQQAVVIGYNPQRRPGVGSAIFLHDSTGGPTAGCVSVAEPELVAIMRWLRSDENPQIVIGTHADVSP